MVDEIERTKEAIRQVQAKLTELKRHGMRALSGGGEQASSAVAPVLRLVKPDGEEP